MSRKWLEKEGPRWVEQKIITTDQLTQISSLYPQKAKATRLLPIFASILVGLGIVTFVASNWEGIPNFWKLVILIGSMLGFYYAGNRFFRAGSPLGTLLTALGVVTFGASIILTGQMYQIIAYDARLFIYWLVAAIFFAYFYNSRILYLLAILLASAGQIYSLEMYRSASVWLGLIAVAGLMWFVYSFRSALCSALFAGMFLVQMSSLMADMNLHGVWLMISLATLYVSGDLLYRQETIGQVFQTVSLCGGFFLTFFLSLEASDYFLAGSALGYYLFLYWVVIVLLSMRAKWKQRRMVTMFEWMLFLPLFTPSVPKPETWDVVEPFFVLILFLYSGYLLWQGFVKENRHLVNMGTIAFLFSSFVAYINIAWDFMPKSLFFLLGGILLFGLNFFLQRKKKELFASHKGDRK